MRKNLSLIFLFILSLVLGFTAGFKFLITSEDKRQKVTIKEETIYVEVAKEPLAIAHGLSDRESLAKDSGMLFVFGTSGNYPFWMDKMKFNLDFIFLNEGIVVDLVENVPFPKKDEKPQIVRAKQNFDKVLEVNQGLIKKLKVKIGDKVEFFL